MSAATASFLFVGSLAMFAVVAKGAGYRAATVPERLTSEHEAFDIWKRMASPFRWPWGFLVLASAAVVSASAFAPSIDSAFVIMGAGIFPIVAFSFVRAFRDARVAARELGIEWRSFYDGGD